MRGLFRPGAIVRLKSGGPRMTVEEVADDGTIRCQWFVGSDVKFSYFPAAALKPADSEPRTGEVELG